MLTVLGELFLLSEPCSLSYEGRLTLYIPRHIVAVNVIGYENAGVVSGTFIEALFLF